VHQFVTRESFVYDVGAKSRVIDEQKLFRGFALFIILLNNAASSSYGLKWNVSSMAV
jgi:hypothetical protein